MKKLALMFLIVFLGSCFSLLAATPFTEDAVKPDDSTNVATGDKSTKVDDKFPVAGTIEAGSRLRLRSWPWGVVLGLFEPGSSVTVTGVSGEFYQVEINGQKGYMHKNYISIPGAPASQAEPYYPGDTRNGGHLSMNEGKTASEEGAKNKSSSSSSSSNSSSSSSAADTGAISAYKGGKLSPAEFSRVFGPVARENMRRTGVPASVTLAQAALETGWGSSSIGDAKNMFGIKGTGPAGSIRVSTQEFVNGRMITIQDNFRKYHSWQESFDDHAKLLQNSRYGYALQYKNNPDRYAQEIHKAGYATDPNYASKLIGIMKANNFYQWDVK
ncbi:MAG TPA: glucosaminidase domain-containing protein [Candidatus Rifleibacterium sp.]|nr:glucosaminidase domain-containing protein [Candidatus Rifleibacterium sp.]